MSVRYVLAPEAEVDLEKADVEIADRVEAVIRQKIDFLARNPGSGHSRNDLTDEPARFFPVYSYLIVYRPESKPLQVGATLHGSRDVEQILRDR